MYPRPSRHTVSKARRQTNARVCYSTVVNRVPTLGTQCIGESVSAFGSISISFLPVSVLLFFTLTLTQF